MRRALQEGLLRNSYYLQVSGLRMEYDPRRAVLARIPVRGTPIPSGRAVMRAERLAVDGTPGEDGEPWIGPQYAAAEGRLVEVRAAPLWLWPAAAASLVLALVIAGVVRRRQAGAA